MTSLTVACAKPASLTSPTWIDASLLCAGDRGQCLLQARAITIDQRDEGALLRKQHRAGTADARAGAGDDCRPSCQSHVSFPFDAPSTKRSDRQRNRRSRTAPASRTRRPVARPKAARDRPGYAGRSSALHRLRPAGKRNRDATRPAAGPIAAPTTPRRLKCYKAGCFGFDASTSNVTASATSTA